MHCKLGETIEQPCSYVLVHTTKVCKGAHLYNGYPASNDDHNSWETCTTSTECKTVIPAVLTVMSGMDAHMISGNLGWVLGYVLGWVVSKWVYYMVGWSWCDSVMRLRLLPLWR
jgi:hypothetical protein